MHYHRNAKTNIEQRKVIKASYQSTRERARQYLISHVTAAKWKAAADFLVQALGFYLFRIHTILTDNGKEFTNVGQKGYGRIGKNPVLFEIVCELAGIDFQKTKAKHPWTNDTAERAVMTVKENTIKLERYESPEAVIIGILHYQDIHNFRYRMKVLNYKTPFQITMEWFVV